MKKVLFTLFLFASFCGRAQYIAVTAKYTDTRLVNNDPEPPSRENRLVLFFYEVSPTGVWTPANLNNYDLWIYQTGFQYGSFSGGVLDSNGNNYPNYAWTAPRVVAYYSSAGPSYIDCYPNVTTHYTVNGSSLDCGFIRVSSWEAGNETFTAPNVCLTYYDWTSPYAFNPGNINFNWPDLQPGPPYNWYSIACGGPQNMVVRGIINQDTMNFINALPVRFAHVQATIDEEEVGISWSNLTESSILHYIVERSLDGTAFQTIGTVLPSGNAGGRADYRFNTLQNEKKVFYRIKAVETGAGFFYSEILSLHRTYEGQAFRVFPNPANGSTIQFKLNDADKGRYVSMVVSPDGRALRQKLIMHNGGDLTREVDLTGLPPGMYQVVLRGETAKWNQKLAYVR